MGNTVGMVAAGASIGAVVMGGVSAACGAASGATGAAILKAAGYSNYVVGEATKIVASGSAVMGGIGGAIGGGIVGGMIAHGFFNNGSAKASPGRSFGGLVSYVGGQTLGGLLGYSFFRDTAASTMPVGTIAASAAVGSAVTAVPITIGLVCCVMLVAGGVVGGLVLADKNAKSAIANLPSIDKLSKALEETSTSTFSNSGTASFAV